YLDLTVVVPVVSVGSNFVINELPSYTFYSNELDDIEVEDPLKELVEVKDSGIRDNVEAFLSTFFQSYSNDDKDKLSYILNDEFYKFGLNQRLSFENVVEAKVFEAKESEYLVQ